MKIRVVGVSVKIALGRICPPKAIGIEMTNSLEVARPVIANKPREPGMAEPTTDKSKQNWKPLRREDLDEVARIAACAHPSLPERREVFEEKLRLFPRGCFALDLDGECVGYAFSHPWTLRSIPPLDSFLERLPPSPDCIWLHDIAVLPAARGSGCAASVVANLEDIAQAEGVPFLALVSVYETEKFWRSLGFQTAALDTGLSAKLESYGPEARYMTRHVQAR